MNRLAMTLVAASVWIATPAFTQTPWIHVEVEEPGDDDTHVKVNLPLSLVEVALDAVPSTILSKHRIHLHDFHDDIDVDDLRRMWNELRNAGDAELVTVTGRDGNVDIRRQGDSVTIRVSERRGDDDNIQIEVPVSVVDALLSGNGEELDLGGAVRELSSRRGDIVRVDDGDTKVRIWIDEKD